jgi:Uma2 family endonuclease
MTMPAHAIPELMTAEELLAFDLPGKSTELVRGRLLVHEPPGYYHGEISARLTYLLGAFVYPRQLGLLFGQDTGFQIASDPDTVRAADLAYLSAERASAAPSRGYARLAPDLVSEIISPSDRAGALTSKIADWLEGGTRLVWVIDPVRSEARIHRADGSISIIPRTGALDGEAVLPGFSCALDEVLVVTPA